ncbi:uncharacterized protein [Antedon mediterranea]|uniref:uncharacterized protein n=1 Tax=Antedon mediterranea TaxID=105859 RepID=UPI003AF705FE
MATGINHFNLDLVSVSTWYDERNLFRQLKVLYRDLISVANIDKARGTLDLLNELRNSGKLSSDNLELLYQTINVTQQFGVINLLPQSFIKAKEVEITKFTLYRLQIVDFGNALTHEDIGKIDALFNTPSKNYEDCWSMILDLEHRQKICEEKMEEFINNLRRLELESAVKSLTKVMEEAHVESRIFEKRDPNRVSVDPPKKKFLGLFSFLKKKDQSQLSPSQNLTSGNEDQVLKKEGKSETEIIEEYLLKRQKNLCSQASVFTPAIMNAKHKVDISQMFTDMELLKENEKKESTPTTLEGMVDAINSTPGCRALVDGEGGIGKTTILRCLSYNWATSKSIEVFEGKIVFLLSVRDCEEDDDIFSLIEKQMDMKDFNLVTDLPEDSKLIKTFINKHADKIVLLVDGLDELRFNNKCLVSLFRKNNLEKSTVILTSRSENIDEFVNVCNIHVRVKGFNSKSIGKYIDKHFLYFGIPELGESLKKELDIGTSHAGLRYPEAYSMCKNPMLLLSMCMLWEEKQALPEDNSDLFKEIFRSILNQFNKQEKFPKISCFEDTPIEYVNAMILLGKCMYYSLKINQLSISKKDLNEQMNKDVVDMALKLGFVYEEVPISKSNFENIFMPPHKLIVESLVGFYLCKLCESKDMNDECKDDVRQLLAPLDGNEWEVIRECEYLQRAREFAVGFLGDKADSFLMHWLTNHLSTYRSLLSCLNFVKRQHEISVVDKLNNHMISKNLEISEHLDFISTSIQLFIHHINPDVQCDGHFIRLIRQLHCMVYEELEEIYGDDSFPFLDTFCSSVAKDCQGRIIAHILGIDDKCLALTIHNLSGEVINHMIKECSIRGVQLALETLDIQNNNLSSIDGTLLGSLLIMSPKLKDLEMGKCNLSGDVMNQMVRECSSRGVQLTLNWLTIDGNNLDNIDGTLLGSLLAMTPMLSMLVMDNCNLTGDVMNHMIRECSNLRHQKLSWLRICGNYLNDIDGTLLGSLFIIFPRIGNLYMNNCNLSGDIMNQMIKECSRRTHLSLETLHMSGNNLSDIDVTLLCSLLCMCPLIDLDISACNLSGEIMNHMLRECSNTVSNSLNISDNNLSNIDGALMGCLFNRPRPKLFMSNCHLSGEMMNQMIKGCLYRGVLLFVTDLYFNDNNLSNIDGDLLVSLLSVFPNLQCIDVRNCNIPIDVINRMIKEGSSRSRLNVKVH